jgi:hypothetical protein
MKNLPLFTELTLSEQEKISGGATTVNFVIRPGETVSQCGDKARTPDGTVIRDFQRINYSKKNKRQVFSRMIIILRGEKRDCPRQSLFSPSSMHEKSIHLSSALKLNSVNKGCFVAK